METKSISDTTLFFWNLALFGLLAFTFSFPFWQTNYFDKVTNGSTKHILLGLGYMTIFVALPLWALSWTLTQFVVTHGQIKVIDWFGVRQKTYTLPTRQDLTIKRETAPYSFRYFPIDSKYNEFRTLYLTTLEGRKLRIQSRYYKNFDDLNVAIRKACY
jgi:hypothetical protein